MKSLGSVDPRSLIGKGTIGLLNATGTYDKQTFHSVICVDKVH